MAAPELRPRRRGAVAELAAAPCCSGPLVRHLPSCTLCLFRLPKPTLNNGAPFARSFSHATRTFAERAAKHAPRAKPTFII